ncbi:MAG: hypothetical protein GY778_26760 [bacterium]|nr:hypothetical protein [bacterium]
MPGASLLLTHPGLATTFTFGLPADPGLAGLVVGTQALVFDAAAPSGIGALANAVLLRVY